MTEADALKRWCPYTRVALTEGMSANRTATMGKGGYADITNETRCLGSGCMAWEFHSISHQLPGGDPEGDCMLKRRRHVD